MYIINEHSGAIVNSDYVMDFHLSDTSDSTLISVQMRGVDKPRTLERYKDRKEAMDALELLFRALELNEVSFRMPESLYYFEETIKRDARTKRKGGS